jgi:hypothetical protein
MTDISYDIYFCTNGDYIYKYLWLEERWTELIGSGKKEWRGITCSDDGQIVLACAFSDYIYKSTNDGTSWTPITLSLSKRNWTGICCSSDGETIIACATWNLYEPNYPEFAKGDYIYISRNAGTSWTKVTGDVGINGNGKSFWSTVSCSSGIDDNFEPAEIVIAAGELPGNVWVSRNSGVTWVNSSTTSRVFKLTNFCTSDISVSSNGSVISLVTIPSQQDIGNAYTSIDSGITWTSFPLNQQSNCIACSSDGKIIAVGTNDNYIYTSNDNNGAGFSQRFSSKINRWSTITVSPDKLDRVFLAAVYGGGIWGSDDGGLTWELDPNSPVQQWIDCCIAKDT